MSRPSLAERCHIHARKMNEEGWYVTEGILWAAGDELARLTAQIEQITEERDRARHLIEQTIKITDKDWDAAFGKLK